MKLDGSYRSMDNTSTSRRAEFFSGLKAEAPILIGVFPFGMIYGVLAVAAGLPPLEAQAMSLFLFAGSAQFLMVQLIGQGTPWVVIILTAFVVNLRHLLYSASVAPYVKSLRARWKAALAYMLTDEAYAVVIGRYTAKGLRPNHQWFFLGAALGVYISWQISTAVGIFLGAQVPASWSLDFTLSLTFIAIIAPAIRDRPSLAAALSAGLVALLTATWPYKLGLALAALVGIMVGLWSEGRWPRSG